MSLRSSVSKLEQDAQEILASSVVSVKGKGRALVIASRSRHCHRRGGQVHGTHQAASHIPALYFPSHSRYSFTDPERMEGWVSPGPGCKEQLAHSRYATARSQLDSNQRPRGCWPRALTTRLSRHQWSMKWPVICVTLIWAISFAHANQLPVPRLQYAFGRKSDSCNQCDNK